LAAQESPLRRLLSRSVLPAQTAPTADAGGDVTEPLDVVVGLDDSGSMATCWPWPQTSPPFNPPCGYPSENPPSDPEELRYSAARLLLQLADDNDRMAVVRFDNLAGGVGDLGVLQPVGAGENRRRLTEALQPPDEYFSRGYTRIDLGLQSALDLLKGAREPGRSQYIILLTDGEPSQPGNVGSQKDRVTAQIEEMNATGISVFPVVLCNPTAGCAGEFLKARFAERGVREAASAQDLVRVFSEIFATMKSDRSVLSGRNAKGALQFTTRAPHGVRKIALVTPRGGLVSLQRDQQGVQPQAVLDDPNIDVSWLEGEGLEAGVGVERDDVKLLLGGVVRQPRKMALAIALGRFGAVDPLFDSRFSSSRVHASSQFNSRHDLTVGNLRDRSAETL